MMNSRVHVNVHNKARCFQSSRPIVSSQQNQQMALLEHLCQFKLGLMARIEHWKASQFIFPKFVVSLLEVGCVLVTGDTLCRADTTQHCLTDEQNFFFMFYWALWTLNNLWSTICSWDKRQVIAISNSANICWTTFYYQWPEYSCLQSINLTCL